MIEYRCWYHHAALVLMALVFTKVVQWELGKRMAVSVRERRELLVVLPPRR